MTRRSLKIEVRRAKSGLWRFHCNICPPGAPLNTARDKHFAEPGERGRLMALLGAHRHAVLHQLSFDRRPVGREIVDNPFAFSTRVLFLRLTGRCSPDDAARSHRARQELFG